MDQVTVQDAGLLIRNAKQLGSEMHVDEQLPMSEGQGKSAANQHLQIGMALMPPF